MATPTNVKVFRNNDKEALEAEIEDWLTSNNPDIDFVTHDGTNDLMVTIWY